MSETQIKGKTQRKLLPELFHMLQPHLAALNAFLSDQVKSFEPEIREHVAYCINAGGKRIRPALIFFSGWDDAEPVNPDLVKLAAVIETIHLATLVHDDIMDGADLRRNRPTASREFGNATSVLLGDALFSHAVFLATQFPTTVVCEKVAIAMRNVCTGEILQTMQRGDPDIDLSTYRRVIDLKTAELFRVACNLGAKLAGATDAFVRSADGFGTHLGIAYQIYDDLADLIGSQDRIGKTLGTDLGTGKATLPIILLRDRLPPEQADQLKSTLSAGEGADVSFWTEKLESEGVVEDVKKAIFAEVTEAEKQIEAHLELPAAERLVTLCTLLRNQVFALNANIASH